MLPFHSLGAHMSAAIVVTRTPDAGDCPDTQRLSEQVERIVGRPLASGPAPTLFVRADFSRAGATYEAKIQLTGAREGERLLRDEGATCDALGDAVAVTTALLFDESARAPLTAAGVGPPVARPIQLWGTGHVGASAGLGGGPTWIAGGALDVSLGPRTSIELGATLAGPHTHPLGTGAVEVRLWYIALGVFRSLTGENVRLGPAVQLLGGVLRGAGEGYPFTSSASLAWFAVGGGLQLDVSIGSNLRLGARTLALVPSRQQSFSIGYVGTAYETSTIAGLAECGLSVKFW